jgi:pimeloyl-ACP methyl ester carboxylesterase
MQVQASGGNLRLFASIRVLQGGRINAMSKKAHMTDGILTTIALALSLAAIRTDAHAGDVRLVEEDVTFRSAGVVLAGTLLIPPKMTTAAVIVHGSGRERRMLPFAREVAKQGIAVLTYDKRGVGQSGGVYAGPEAGTNNVDATNLQLLASDASAAVQELIRRLSSKRVPVGLIGFSQAGWIIPLAARVNANVEFLVLWSGPVVTTREQMRFQDFTQQRADFWDHHSEQQARDRIRVGPDRFVFTDTDPRDSLKKIDVPSLWLFGGRDVNVPVKLSVERLQQFAAQGKPFEYRLFPTSPHILDESQALPAMLEWLERRAARAR